MMTVEQDDDEISPLWSAQCAVERAEDLLRIFKDAVVENSGMDERRALNVADAVILTLRDIDARLYEIEMAGKKTVTEAKPVAVKLVRRRAVRK